jgi:hypothetical protein
MSTTSDIVIIGAGPYGLSAAAHLRRAGIDCQVFGEPMSFWRTMPRGMFLRSNRRATNIAEYQGDLSLASYQAATGVSVSVPVPLESFVAYGEWVQQRVVPDVDRRLACSVDTRGHAFDVTLEDGDRVTARRVIVACGIRPFAWRPPEFRELPRELASHTGDHADLARFAGQRVAVIGGGQSALESAALLHEAGAEVEMLARSRRIVWLRGVSVYKRLGPVAPIAYAPTDVGPLWYSRLVAVPDVFRRLPRRAQTRIAARCIRPAGAHWVRERVVDVPLRLGVRVRSVRPRGGALELALDDGAHVTVDHLLLGTGYRVDVGRYGLLDPHLLARVRVAGGYPILGPGLESTVPGLHFLGAPAAWSFGPIMRFVSGSWYASRALVRQIAGRPAVLRSAGGARPAAHESQDIPAPTALLP